jgi:hypothetical protein
MQLQQLYSRLSVLVKGAELGNIRVKLGLKQGCPCSPLLFSLFFDRVSDAISRELG